MVRYRIARQYAPAHILKQPPLRRGSIKTTRRAARVVRKLPQIVTKVSAPPLRKVSHTPVVMKVQQIKAIAKKDAASVVHKKDAPEFKVDLSGSQKAPGWYPPDVASDDAKKLYEKFRLRSFGAFSQSYLEGDSHYLEARHWEHVKDNLKKFKAPDPRNSKELEKWYEKVILTPEQELMAFNEASGRGPLNHKASERYFELFEQLVGKEQFKRLLGGSPHEVVEGAKKQEEALKKAGMIPR